VWRPRHNPMRHRGTWLTVGVASQVRQDAASVGSIDDKRLSHNSLAAFGAARVRTRSPARL